MLLRGCVFSVRLRFLFFFEEVPMPKQGSVPSVEEVPAKVSRAGDVTLMNWQDALIRVVDCQRELKEAKAELKTAQAARVKALVQRSFGEPLL